MLITGKKNEEPKEIEKRKRFRGRDELEDKITKYDESFWQDYNIISPSKKLLEMK
ncbi:MAG: hypothetical protein K8S16_08275 [Bacteroidales bacterium]|nr:hypothetical protein [Bacteroidales bacterium]